MRNKNASSKPKNSPFIGLTINPLKIKLLLFHLLLFGCLSLSTQSVTAQNFRKNTVYYIPLKGTLVDYKEKAKFSDMLPSLIGLKPKSSIGLNELLKNIETAAKHPNVKGIYLWGGELKGGFAAMEELRKALLDFKKSGKFIIAYADKYTQSNYYLASVADKIMLNPYGTVDIKGLSSKTTFYKTAIDKLGVEMQVLRVGTFKSAVEPVLGTEMSEANRIQTSEFLGSIWNNVSGSMANERKINKDSINIIADTYSSLLPTNDLHKLKLVDALVYVDQTDSILKQIVQVANIKEIKKIAHPQFSSKNRGSKSDNNKIAIVYLNGSIGENDAINANNVRRICRSLETNTAVKAVVLRINSPGGSAFESEKIWRSIHQLKRKKPVVVSMGNVAASGGYYIACHATHIFAQPTTITGSIGIFGVFPNLKGLNDKAGLNYETVKTNKLSDAYGSHRAFNDEERALMQANIERGYELFVTRCAEGRNKTTEQIKAVAEGRVWTGEDALKHGLVDALGGLNDAIAYAAKEAKLQSYQKVVAMLNARSKNLSLVSIEQKVEQKVMQNQLGDYYQLYKMLNEIESQDKIQARMLEDFAWD
jgi:protease-4